MPMCWHTVVAIKSHILEGNSEENGWGLSLSLKSIMYTHWAQFYLRDYTIYWGEERQKKVGKALCENIEWCIGCGEKCFFCSSYSLLLSILFYSVIEMSFGR